MGSNLYLQLITIGNNSLTVVFNNSNVKGQYKEKKKRIKRAIYLRYTLWKTNYETVI